MNEYALTLDLAKAKQRQQQTIFVRQGDRNATTIVATVTDHGAAAATSGLTARFQMRLPDSTHYYRKAASLSGNVATVALDEAQAASAVGRTDVAYFQLMQGSTVVASTESFTVIVLPDALADATVPESYDSAIQDAIDALDAAVEQMPDMVEDVLEAHPEWTTTVQDGSITAPKLATDLARDRERLLYRLANMLTNALPEGETATASDAAQTPVAGLALYGRSTQDGTPTPSAPVPIVSVAPDSQGNISLWARGFNQWDEVAEDGYISDTTGENIGSNTVYLRSKGYIPVFPNTEYHFTCTTSNTNGKVCYYDADKAFLSFEGVVFNGPDKTTPATARYMRFWLNYPGSYNHDICINISDPSRNGTYAPYAATVTPIDLDGHELRSLPDGTRDEVTVDEYGHAVLVQRVGEVDPSTLAWEYISVTANSRFTCRYSTLKANSRVLCTKLASATSYWDVYNHVVDNSIITHPSAGQFELYASAYTSDSALAAALAGSTLLFALATPVTHDLGYVDAVPLCGPDLTAQAIPTAPFALTYERDLNTTLARLESAIADVATS